MGTSWVQSGESHERHVARSSSRNRLFRPAFFRIPRSEIPSLDLRSTFMAACLMTARLAGPLFFRTPPSSSRWRPFSISRWERTAWVKKIASSGRDEMKWPCPRPCLLVVVLDQDDAADAGRILPSGEALPGHSTGFSSGMPSRVRRPRVREPMSSVEPNGA